jgi:hypothetical protein
MWEMIRRRGKYHVGQIPYTIRCMIDAVYASGYIANETKHACMLYGAIIDKTEEASMS